MEIINGSIRLLGDRILLRPLEWTGEDVHGAGSMIEVQRNGRPLRGEVLAVGKGRHPFKYLGKSDNGQHMRVTERKYFQRTEVKVGDVVELGGLNVFDGLGYQFTEVLFNGRKCVICTERDVAGVMVAA